MPTGSRRSLWCLAALSLALACQGPRVPDPRVGQSRYTCCNIRYEKPEFNDANYQVGTLVPFGTRVQILEVGKNSVTFQASGGPPLTAVLRYGKDVITRDQFIDRLLVADDPHAKLKKVSAARQKLIAQGGVEKGMPREQVLLSLGYPPAHRTPSLESGEWHYWRNTWHQYVVFFDGNKVDRVQD
jgi:hypothetical protein